MAPRTSKAAPSKTSTGPRGAKKKAAATATPLRRATLGSRMSAIPRARPIAAKRKLAPPPPKAKDCPICLQAFPADEKRSLRSAGLVEVDGCGHEFCKPCLAQFCTVALQDNKGLETGGALPCPVPNCRGKGVLAPAEVKELVEEVAWEKHKERRAAHQVCMYVSMVGGWRGWVGGGWIRIR
jgi:hypothetical protein